MRDRYFHRRPEYWPDAAPHYYDDYDYPYHPRRSRSRRDHGARRGAPATGYYGRIAYDAGEPGPPRGGGRRWRRYLDQIGRFKERRQGRRLEDLRAAAEEDERADAFSRGRRFARRYKEPVVGAALAGAALPFAVGAAGGPGEAQPEEPVEPVSRQAEPVSRPVARGTVEEDVGSRLASLRQERVREATIQGAMTAYNISRNLAEMIHDIAVQNDIEPELAFGLVKTESAFDHRAVSSVGARGLTQVMPRTARWLRPGTTIEDLYNRRLNLDMGFGYLRDLIDKYDGDVRLALLAYNRGPGTVDRVLSRGGDPDNGYADLVLEGYTDLS